MRQLLLLRPEPGLSASTARARAMGLEVVACPLFQVEPIAWDGPDPASYDAILLTSANAVRHGGAGLEALKGLPVHAVGEATAEAARKVGFHVQSVGAGHAAELIGSLPPSLRLLHLSGKDHRVAAAPNVERRVVYSSASIDRPDLPALVDLVAAVHSPRAGARLAELADRRDRVAIAAISGAAADAAGTGWHRVEIADQPNDASLLALAAMLCHTLPRT